MTQLTLDLHIPAAPSLANFVAGRNADCLALMHRIADGDRARRFVHLWGARGSGCSHLLRGVCAEAPGARAIAADDPVAAFAFEPDVPVYAVDDAQALGPAQQEALFHLFNRLQAAPHAALVVAADAPPRGLPLREDLRTRLGWGHVFQLQALTEPERRAVLRQAADARGVFLGDEVMDFMLTRFSRDLGSLMQLLEQLDGYALQTKRAITIPLIKSMLEDE